MKRLVPIVLLIFLLIESYGQGSVSISVSAAGYCPCSPASLSGVKITFNGVTTNSTSYSNTYSSYPSSSLRIRGTLSCSGHSDQFDKTFSLTNSSCGNFTFQSPVSSVNGIGASCDGTSYGSTATVNFNWVSEKLSEPTQVQYCESETISISAPASGGNHDWSYKTQDQPSYSNVNNDKGRNAVFTPQAIFGSSYSNYFGETFTLRVSNGIYCQTSDQSYVFYPEPPTINTSPTASAPACHGSLGSITFNSSDLSRAPSSNETYFFMIYEDNSPPTFAENDALVGINYDDLPETVEGGSGVYNGSNITFDLPANDPGKKYYAFIYPAASNGDAFISTGCADPTFYEFTISDPPEMTVNSSINNNPPCHDHEAQVSLSIQNGNAPYIFEAHYNSTTSALNPTGGTSHAPTFDIPLSIYSHDFSIEITDNNECVVSSPVFNSTSFTNPPNYSLSAGFNSNITCYGDQASIKITSNVNDTYSFTLTDGDTFNQTKNGTQEGVDFTNVPAGTYSFFATNSNGCEDVTSSSQITTNIPTQVITSEISTTAPTCPGENGFLIVNGNGGSGSGYEYQLGGGPWQTSGTFSDYPAGTYLLKSRDDNLCESSPLEVTIPESDSNLDFVLNAFAPTCNGTTDGSIAISSVSGEGSVEFSFDEINYSSATEYSGFSSGPYTIYARDNDCSTSKTIFVPDSPDPISFSVQVTDLACNGDESGVVQVLAPSGGNGNYSYAIDGGSPQSDNTFSSLNPGIYTITVFDDQGCSTVQSDIEVFQPQLLEITSMDITNISCNSASDATIVVNALGGTPNYSYELEGTVDRGTQTSQLFENLPPGNYVAKTIDQNGCEAYSSSVEIGEPTELTINSTQVSDALCYGEMSGAIQVVPQGGTGSYQYNVNNTGWISSSTFSNLSAGEYSIIVQDTNGCQIEITETISEPNAPLTTSFTIVNATCDALGKIIAEPEGGTPQYFFTWSGITQTGSEVDVAAGIYELTLTDENGCELIQQVAVPSDDGPEITEINKFQPSCSTSANGQVSLELNGIEPFTVEWANGATTLSVNNLVVGDNLVEILDGNGCLTAHNVVFTGPADIKAIKVSESLASCNGESDGSISISISGGTGDYDVTWENGQTATLLSNIAAGDHFVTISDENGCQLTTSFSLAETPPLSISTQLAPPSCTGEEDGSISVFVTGGTPDYSYTWSSGETSPFLSNIGAGTFQIAVIDANGCELVSSLELNDPPETEISLENLTICSGQQISVNSPITGSDYYWTGPESFEAFERDVIISEQGVYALYLTDFEGCSATGSFEVIIDDDILNADFLVAGEAFVGDTLLVIDISWPIPENVTWDFPEEAQIISQSSDFAELVFSQAGTYHLGVTCALAGCNASYFQTITIKDALDQEEGFAFAEPQAGNIRELVAYPNPSDGPIMVKLNLKKVMDATLRFSDISGNKVPISKILKSEDSYQEQLDLSSLQPGIYFIQAIAGNDQETIRVVIR